MTTENKRYTRIGAFLVGGCFMLWGVLPIFWKQLSALDSMYILASRLVWSVVFYGLILTAAGRLGEVRSTIRDREQLKLSFLCGALITVNWGSYIIAVNTNHIIDASLAYYLNPILSIAIACIFLKEHLSARKWVSVCIAFAGVLFSILSYHTVPVLALVMGGTFAVYGLFKKKVRADAVVFLFMESSSMAAFALAYIIFCEVSGNGWHSALAGPQFLLLPLAGVVTGVPLLLYGIGVRRIPYSISGLLMYLNPTTQLILGLFLYGEHLTKPTIVMFVCVWVALILFLTDRTSAEKS